MLTPTERAIGELWYRLVYVSNLKTLDEVPQQYRGFLELVRQEHEKN